uniref:Uncharacterized protein n=1 Tax=Vespula pensylvanica TaxID=30213 RepID=A0A834PCU4_VESPE|nr:hypothetical protein H0235_003894 [Vespula pensylvanica]
MHPFATFIGQGHQREDHRKSLGIPTNSKRLSRSPEKISSTSSIHKVFGIDPKDRSISRFIYFETSS